MKRRHSIYFYFIATLCCAVLWLLFTQKAFILSTELSRSHIKKNFPWNQELHDDLGLATQVNPKIHKVRTEAIKPYSETRQPWYRNWYERLIHGRKLILLYTTWFAELEWGELSGNGLYERMEHCEKATNCLLTYDKSWMKEASGVVFHGRDVEEYRNSHYSAKKLKEARKGLPLTQKWIYLSHENPWKGMNVYRPYDGLFNWTATFSRKSSIFIPFNDYAPRLNPEIEMRNYAKRKTGLVAWAVSNCNAKLRLEYVRHLQRYVSVTVYGKCNCYFANRKSCKHFDNGCKKEFSKYKFFLALENDFCHDYVTEKYWERIQQDVVPVVMGSNYDGVAIPGSYIDVNGFESIRELADYLLYLDRNDAEYNKYFRYKQKFKAGSGDFYCRICEKLNSEESKKKSQVILSEEWNYEKNCEVNRGKAEKLQKQIENARKDRSVPLSMYTAAKC